MLAIAVGGLKQGTLIIGTMQTDFPLARADAMNSRRFAAQANHANALALAGFFLFVHHSVQASAAGQAGEGSRFFLTRFLTSKRAFMSD